MINKLRWPIFTSRARAAGGILLPVYNRIVIAYRPIIQTGWSRAADDPERRVNARQHFSPLIGRARARGEREAHLVAAH